MSAAGSPDGGLPTREPGSGFGGQAPKSHGPPQRHDERELVASALARLRRRLARDDGDHDRYRVEAELARGGMGAVYRVWDDELHRRSAMKICLEDADLESLQAHEAQALHRFLVEAELTAQLDHPGIVPVHEAGVDAQGRVYFTMRLVEGESLLDLIERSGRSRWDHARAARKVLLKICEAVAFAHSRGIVHRDLKPANIMVGPFGEVYVMDWGLAAALDSEEQRAGIISGTPAYMAPEQARGEAPDPRADVYSAGAILYHLLTGEMPYGRESSGDVAELFDRLLREAPTPLSEIDPELPAELVAIAEKAMARQLDQRYPSMDAMIEDLHAWLDGRVVHAYESGAVAELRKWLRRNPLPVALALVVGGGLGAFAIVVGRQNEALAIEVSHTHEENYAANMHAAEASLRVFEAAEAKLRLNDCEPELRHWEWHHLAKRADSSSLVLRGHGDDVQDVAFHPDGRWLASASSDSSVRIWDLRLGKEAHAVQAPAPVTGVAFAPDGSLLAATCVNGAVLILDPATGRVRNRVATGGDPLVAIAFDPLARRIVVGARRGHVHVLAAPDWQPTRSFRAVQNPTHEQFFELADLSLSPDGERVVVGAAVGSPTEWDVRTGEWLRTIDMGPMRTLESVRHRPDGRTLVVGTPLGEILEWSLERNALAGSYKGHTGAVKSAAFTPDGARVVSASNDGTLRSWSARSKVEELVHVGHDRGLLCSAISADGTQVATGSRDQTVRVWRLASSAVRALGRGLGWVVALDERPGDTPSSGARLAVVTRHIDEARYHLVVWDVTTGERIFDRPSTDRIDTVLFDPKHPLIWTGSERRGLLGWSSVDGELVHEWPLGDGVVVTALASGVRPGTLLAGTPEGELIECRTSDGEVLRRWRGHGDRISSLARGPGALFVSGSWDGSIGLWNADDVRPVRWLEGHTGTVGSVTFDPLGERVLSASSDDTLRIWDVASGDELQRLVGHDSRFEEAGWSPDGARIVSGSANGAVRVWHARTGRPLLTLRAHGEPVTCVRFSADGARILSASEDQSVLVWEAD